MNLLNIKGKDLFELERVSVDADSKGEKRIVVDYVKHFGPKNSLKVVFEGFYKGDIARVKKQFTLTSLLRVFDDRRFYIQGVLFFDGQFKDEDKKV